MYTQVASTERVMTFCKALGAGVLVLGILVARLWQPGMGGMLSDTTKSDWIPLGVIFGTLLVLIALAVAMKW